MPFAVSDRIGHVHPHGVNQFATRQRMTPRFSATQKLTSVLSGNFFRLSSESNMITHATIAVAQAVYPLGLVSMVRFEVLYVWIECRRSTYKIV